MRYAGMSLGYPSHLNDRISVSVKVRFQPVPPGPKKGRMVTFGIRRSRVKMKKQQPPRNVRDIELYILEAVDDFGGVHPGSLFSLTFLQRR